MKITKKRRRFKTRAWLRVYNSKRGAVNFKPTQAPTQYKDQSFRRHNGSDRSLSQNHLILSLTENRTIMGIPKQKDCREVSCRSTIKNNTPDQV